MSESAFSIGFIGSTPDTSRGEIRLGQFVERFDSPLEFWTADEYELQWREGIRRLIEGEYKSALVTAMYPPDTANFIVWWVMYRDSSSVIFRNHMLLLGKAEGQFDLATMYFHIPDRADEIDEEFPISEWTVELESLKRSHLC